MKLSTREDVAAPVAFVFATLHDYETFERAALRRGAEVQRTGTPTRPEWSIGFTFRGRPRRLTVREVSAEPPVRLTFYGIGKLFQGDLRIDLVELGRMRTRIALTVEVRPLTLPARILLQSAQLARGRILRGMQKRTVELAQHVEAQWRDSEGKTQR